MTVGLLPPADAARARRAPPYVLVPSTAPPASGELPVPATPMRPGRRMGTAALQTTLRMAWSSPAPGSSPRMLRLSHSEAVAAASVVESREAPRGRVAGMRERERTVAALPAA